MHGCGRSAPTLPVGARRDFAGTQAELVWPLACHAPGIAHALLQMCLRLGPTTTAGVTRPQRVASGCSVDHDLSSGPSIPLPACGPARRRRPMAREGASGDAPPAKKPRGGGAQRGGGRGARSGTARGGAAAGRSASGAPQKPAHSMLTLEEVRCYAAKHGSRHCSRPSRITPPAAARAAAVMSQLLRRT